jgi:hypothetical protein
LLHHGWDMAMVSVFSLAVFFLALKTRLGDAEAAQYVTEAAAAIGDKNANAAGMNRRHRRLEP